MNTRIKFVQEQLNKRNRNAGEPDGHLGNNTRKALDTVIGLPKDWNDNKKVIGTIQLLAMEQKIDLAFDGLWGMESQHALDVLQELEKTGKLSDVEAWRSAVEETGHDVPLNQWPKETNKSMTRFYGPVGENQTRIQLPFEHRLAWDLDVTVKSFKCHEKVHDSMKRVLTRVLDHYGPEKIKELRLDLWGGCLNVRKIRGGDRWSTHAWGIAVDYDPSNNKLKWGKDRATLARPEYEKWWQLWEEEGWLSLGRYKNYDWMHIQAARR